MDEVVCDAMLEKARVLFTEEPRGRVKRFWDSVVGNETRVQNVRRMVANAVERELGTTWGRHHPAADRFHLARRAGESNVIVFTLPIMQELAKVDSFDDMELSVKMTGLAEQIADLGKEVKAGRVSVDYFLEFNAKSWDRLATMNLSLGELLDSINDGFPDSAWFDDTRAKVDHFRKERDIVLQFVADSRHDLSEVAAKVEAMDGRIQISGILEQGTGLLPVKEDEMKLLWFFHTAYRDSRIARDIWEESAEKGDEEGRNSIGPGCF